MKHTGKRTGAQVLVDQLRINGVQDVFCVPGESYLSVLDALYESTIRLTICRQEGGAAMMAEANGKITGKPGVCFVTRGPGATNASAGLHIAQHDGTPMVLFIGQIARETRGRGAFQEVDYRAFFGSIAKWVFDVEDAVRLPEIIHRAFHVAINGRPGPVVIALPEDMLTDLVTIADAPPAQARPLVPAPEALAAFGQALARAQAPVLIAGGTRWDAQAVEALKEFAQSHALPVAVSFRRQMLFPVDHPNFIGDLGIGANPAVLERIRAADLVIALGARLGEMPSQGYTLFDIPGAGDRLVLIDPEAEQIGRVYASRLGMVADPASFLAAAAPLPASANAARTAAVAQARTALAAWRAPKTIPGPLQMSAVMAHLNAVLSEQAILTNGAGNYATWLHRFYDFRQFGTQAAPTSGSMGYGLPAAVGLKRALPEREVVCFAGDGCFLMHGQEFATAVQYDLPIIVLVIDNGMYGTIRMHQEREYPGRVSGTALINPDFAALARAYGGHGERVERTEDFAPALARAKASGKPAILHLLLDPEAITPATTLSALRQTALEKLGNLEH